MSSAESVPSAEPFTDETACLEAVLPRELDGVELHSFAVGEDILARLASRFGVVPDDLETAFASDHGARFLQMYAIQAAREDGRRARRGLEPGCLSA